MKGKTDSAQGVRIDKWLWAARFFKTRALAQQAVEGGKVRLNGDRPKCSRELKTGDKLILQIQEQEWVLTVLSLSNQRGPAPVARLMYAEDEASMALRAQKLAEKHQMTDPGSHIRGRPTKRDRRLIHRFNERG